MTGTSSGNILMNLSRLDGLQLPPEYRSRRVTRLTGVAPGDTALLCDIEAAGCINHIWMTLGDNNFRNIILRMYWDDEEDPSVEAPITDLFGLGHNIKCVQYATPALAVSPNNGLNIYLPMPFATRARVTLSNENDEPVNGGVYFQADYSEYEGISDCPLRFHAQWRRDSPALRRAKFYTIAEAVGRGYFMGVTYHIRVRDNADAWYHGGGDEILIDGGTPNADVIHGIGGEDFFGASWGIEEFQTPYCGCILAGERLSMYRHFLESPIRFEDSVRVSFGAMANDITSVGYWYQTEPHHRFFRLPPPEGRQPENDLAGAEFDVELLPEQQGAWAVIGPFAGGIDDRFALEEEAVRPRGIDLNDPATHETNYPEPYKDAPADGPRTVRWERVRTDLHWLDLNALLMPKLHGPTCVQTVHGVAYVLARVRSTRDWRARLLLTHDDAARVWLDGHEVYSGIHADNYATELIPVEIRRGVNTFLVKTTNTANENWGAWCLSLRICQHDGAPTDAITYDPLDEVPESLLLLRSAPSAEGPNAG